ncbi:MAG: helix-turn-helix domain-containing protein [bacterium]
MSPVELLNDRQVHEMTGLACISLRRARCEGWREGHAANDLPYVKLGRSVRYKRSDVEAWIERHTITPMPTEK